jgi:PAS domain S-box-containing protein
VADALESARVDLLTTMMSLHSERDWSDRLLASIVEGIITLDGENKITFFSHGAERITGWSKTKVIGHLIDDVFKIIDSDESFSTLIPSMPSGRQKFDIQVADNRIVSLAITSAQLSRSGEKEKEIAFVFRDISEEEAVHRLLGHFLANVAHEFLTPLSALEASIEILLDQTPDLSPGELNELHTSLHLGILGLHNLVINLLESANIEARRFRISPRAADLGNIISDAVQTIQPLLIKYEQRLTLQLPLEIPSVRADARRTVQVLTNLLSNASRYGPPGDEIALCVTIKKENVHIAVVDKGPGIPPEHRSNIFRRFVFPQANDAISKEGAGLGLSVVKAIVTAQNGQVGVDENPAGGSIFWFTLPIVKEGL